MRNYIGAFAAACALLLAGCAHAPVAGPSSSAAEPLAADGVYELDVKDLSASRNGAVLDAERAAVGRAAALYLDEDASPEAARTAEEGLLKKPALYVAKYKTLSESRDGGYYRVRLKVWVYHGRIASALRALKLAGPGASGPRAAFVFTGPPAPAFASAFKEAFSKRSPVAVEDLRPAAGDADTAEGRLAAAADAGADLLIEASASAGPAGAAAAAGFYPAKADASARIYDVPAGKLLLELSSQANGIDSAEPAAEAKALAAAGELLAQDAASRAARLARQDAPLKLKFFGVDGLEPLEKLKAELARLDARGLRLESFDQGTAVFLAVPRRPDPQEFASSVLRSDALGLELEGVGPQEIAFSLPR
ncbi:MAG: hypothetical protein M0025_13100 [Elusimicrobia bacterium]|nr:hypothetical protein [Elusimicrobiota bacterium]